MLTDLIETLHRMGFIQRWVDGTLIRFRVSILPIASAKQEVHAESIVIRILDDRKVLTDLTKIGLNGVAMERFNQAIRQPNGNGYSDRANWFG